MASQSVCGTCWKVGDDSGRWSLSEFRSRDVRWLNLFLASGIHITRKDLYEENAHRTQTQGKFESDFMCKIARLSTFVNFRLSLSLDSLHGNSSNSACIERT